MHHNLSTSDATSTSNLRKHAIQCWGKDIVDAAKAAGSAEGARGVLKKKENLHDGSIAIEFERIGKGKPTYSIHPRSKFEIWADHISWMSESKRPFNLVSDAGYHRVMKKGHPGHYIPSDQTIRRDLHHVFVKSQEKIAKRLQVRTYLICDEINSIADLEVAGL